MNITNENLNITGGQFNQYIVGDRSMSVIGGWRRIENNGSSQAPYNGGSRMDYCTKQKDTRPGFDVGLVYLAWVDAPEGASGQYEAEWRAGCSPKDGVGNWSYFHTEINIGSFVDCGYAETINGNHATGGHLFGATVPSAFGPAGSSKNVTFALATAGIPRNDWYAQFYNGFLINSNSIAKSGKGIQANGADLVDDAPAAVIDVTRNWETAIKLERGNYKDNKAVTLRSGQKIVWDDGTESVHLTPQQIRKLLRLLS